MDRVLITGAAGGIGRSLRESLLGVYRVLRLSDRVPLAPARTGEEVLTLRGHTGEINCLAFDTLAGSHAYVIAYTVLVFVAFMCTSTLYT